MRARGANARAHASARARAHASARARAHASARPRAGAHASGRAGARCSVRCLSRSCACSRVQGGNRRQRYLTALGSARETIACFDVAVSMDYVAPLDDFARGPAGQGHRDAGSRQSVTSGRRPLECVPGPSMRRPGQRPRTRKLNSPRCWPRPSEGRLRPCAGRGAILEHMRAFAEAQTDSAIGQQPVGQLPLGHYAALSAPERALRG